MHAFTCKQGKYYKATPSQLHEWKAYNNAIPIAGNFGGLKLSHIGEN